MTKKRRRKTPPPPAHASPPVPARPHDEEELTVTRQRSNALVAFACGAVFAVGLGLAGMTSPAKVLAFLDVTSAGWDPSLAFVMVGAIGVHFLFARRAAAAARAGERPVAAARFHLPAEQTVDRPLILGAALFGMGWGLAGYCPGPAVVAFIAAPTAVVFVGAMLTGMWGARLIRARREARAGDRAIALAMERELEAALTRPRDASDAASR